MLSTTLTDILWRNANLVLCQISIIMLKNQFKKPFQEEMKDNLEEMHQVLSDIGQATIQLNAKLKSTKTKQVYAGYKPLKKNFLRLGKKLRS